MTRREPPPLATWMLDHLSTGERDEALAGDLLEVFRSGRSDAWYWRQASAACAISWFNSLRKRASLYIFALAWSMLAPVWTTIIDRIQNASRLYGELWRMDWPFSTLAHLSAWFCLNLIFLWTGILLYFLLQQERARALGRKTIRNAFLKPLLFLLPVYFATFAVTNLFSYPGITIDRRTLTPLAEFTDLRLWADILRLPYFITLLAALWNAVPQPRFPSDSKSSGNSETSDALANLDPYTLTRFFSLMVAAGLLNAIIIGLLICRLPETYAPNLRSLFVTAAEYVLVGALAGIAGSWLYWKNPSSPFRERSPLPFPLFALVCASGWVWVTPMLLLAEQVSPATAFAAMIGALVLAAGLRSATYPVYASSYADPYPLDAGPGDLFAESLFRAPFRPHGYVIALSLYAGSAALLTRSNYTAAMCLALSAAVFAWMKSFPQAHCSSRAQAYRRVTLRLAIVALPAIVFTAWALMDGIANRNSILAKQAALAAEQKSKQDAIVPPNPNASRLGGSGYESLILWPFPPKKQFVAPVLVADPWRAPGIKQPIILRFDGTYEYVQPPDKRPGSNAHRAQGTPLKLDIASRNEWPVMMDARQSLSAPIPLSKCRELDIEIENGDNRKGVISLGLLLGEGLPNHERTADLGEKPVTSTEPGNFYVKDSPVSETVRFAIPRNADLRKFSEITILVLPGAEHMFVSPKIAIREFRLIPR